MADWECRYCLKRLSVDFESSKIISAPLVAIIVSQGLDIPDKQITRQVRNDRSQEVSNLQKQNLETLDSQLDPHIKRAVQEKGASSWLTVLPLKDQGFTLNKEEFRGALSLRYDRKIKNLPSKCSCGELFIMLIMQ